MENKFYGIYFLGGLFAVYPYTGNEKKWNNSKEMVKNKILDMVRKNSNSFTRYTRKLYCYSWNSQIIKRWAEILYDVLLITYKNNHEALENLMVSFEKSDFCVQKKLLFPEMFRKMLFELFDKNILTLHILIELCKQEKYGNIKRKFIRYSTQVIGEYSNSVEIKNAFLKKCKMFLYMDKSKEDKLALMHLIGVGKCMSKDLFNSYCKMVYSADEERIRYYYGVYEIAWLAFLYPEIIYPEYYFDRKIFLKDMAVKMQKVFYKAKKADDGTQKIGMTLTGLHGKAYASTRLELYLANELHKKGYEVRVFVSDANNIVEDFDGFLNPTGTRKDFSTINISEFEDMIDEGVSVYYNNGKDYREIFNNYLEAIYEYNPDLIVDISWEQPIFSHLLIDNFPIIMVPLGGVSSSAAYDRIIVRNMEAVHKMNQECYSIDEDKAVEGNIYIPYELNTKNQNFKKMLKIKKNEYVLVTVGNRLDAEIDKEFAECMTALLHKHRDMRWIVVGLWKAPYSGFDEFITNKQIIRAGFVENLPALYRACDIFVNPLRIGGGGSIAMFVQGGKPAAVSNMASDILPFIGEETCIKGAASGIFSFVEKVYLDRNIGKELAQMQKRNLLRSEFTLNNYANIVLREYKKINKSAERKE